MTDCSLLIGKIQIFGIRDGFFFLDGGAMFGVVPKVIWNKTCPADNDNLIKLGLNCLLIRTPETLVLVETGVGAHLKKKLYAYYAVDRNPELPAELNRLGIEPPDIDIVVNTHLHFDHCGGNITASEDGTFVPAYPNARYVIQRGEWENALHPCSRDRVSYVPHTFLPLEPSEHLQLVDGEDEIATGITVFPAAGHTAGHQCLKVESEGETFLFLGDMVPTAAHIALPYIMSYDLFPTETYENKERILQQAVTGDWIVAFSHEIEHFFGRVRRPGKRFIFEPLA